MQLKKNKFAAEAAGVTGLVYIVCALFVYLFPAFSVQLMGWLTHVSNASPRIVTLEGFIGGLIQVLIYACVAAWLFAWLLNRSVKE